MPQQSAAEEVDVTEARCAASQPTHPAALLSSIRDSGFNTKQRGKAIQCSDGPWPLMGDE